MLNFKYTAAFFSFYHCYETFYGVYLPEAYFQFSVFSVMEDKRVDIFLAGDSTMCFYTADRAPRTGWGMALQKFCSESVRVHNCAQSGYSTKSFQKSGWFAHLLAGLRPGDHVVIQFGHNDKHPADYRPLAHTEVDEFASNLRSFATQVRERGAIPVLVTTTIEWAPDGLDKRAPLLAEYNAATLDVARNLKVDVIDLNRAAYEKLSLLPIAEIHQYHMAASGVENTENDFCHLKQNGAEFYAALFVELCRNGGAAVAECFK